MDAINKTEFIAVYAEAMNIPKTKAKEYVENLLTCLGNCFVEGKTVAFNGFGTFLVQNVAEREGHNPATGEPITIPAHNKVVFKPSSVLKNAMN